MAQDGIGGARAAEQGRDMQRLWIALGALAGLIAIAMAALAAHAFGSLDPGALAMMRTAIEMQGWHALALLACGLWAPRGGRLADLAGAAFAAGTALFCGAVYMIVLGGSRLGIMAPAGGTLLMAGWLLLGLSALIATRAHQ
jgi:uncharacterized membrane protein YgdD (TMEM256/DUF423 family)